MDERELTCCFTGHRPNRLPWGADESDLRCLAMKEELRQRLEGIRESGYRHFICGMAIGCDMVFAEAVLEMKRVHPELTLEAAIPCGRQPERWSKAQRQRYNRIIDRCDRVTVLQIEYSPDCMMRRNRYMVDRSSLVLACFNGLPGGTMNTLAYAVKQKVPVIQIEIEA